MNAPFIAFSGDDTEITLDNLTVQAGEAVVRLHGELSLRADDESLARAIALRVCLDEVIRAIRAGAPPATESLPGLVPNPFAPDAAQ